jgi:hypothetical protein
MGKASRDKGKRWERAVAKDLREIYGQRIRRGWQAREGDDEADIHGTPWFWYECKHHKLVNYRAALRQATAAAPEGLRPVVVAKDDRLDPVVVLYWRDWLWLLRLLFDLGLDDER